MFFLVISWLHSSNAIPFGMMFQINRRPATVSFKLVDSVLLPSSSMCVSVTRTLMIALTCRSLEPIARKASLTVAKIMSSPLELIEERLI